ncbi:quinone oxidoreductase, partial [Thioclava sp. BHET1]
MKAVVMNGIGEADQLECVERPDPLPGVGEVLIDVAAAGVNFMDIGVRRGAAWTETSNPKVVGVEGSGRIVALGEGVTDFALGDRVAWVYIPGSYSEKLVAPGAA